MADFNLAVALTLQHEGGFIDLAADPGGATKYGITQADMPGVQIADLTDSAGDRLLCREILEAVLLADCFAGNCLKAV